MKYLVQILHGDELFSEDVIEAPSAESAAASMLIRSEDVFDDDLDFSAWDEEEFAVDRDDVVETQVATIRIHRLGVSDEERMILKSMNERADSPFKGMIAMPPED